MVVLAREFGRLETDERWGLVALWLLATLFTICLGGACAPDPYRLTGAGLGGAVGFLLSGFGLSVLLIASRTTATSTDGEAA